MIHQRAPRSMFGAAARQPLAAVVLALACMHAPARATDGVAEVTLIVGEALVLHADGTTEALRRGASIRVGDRVETASNGHVHLRFADNGAVSVRPDSVFEVQAFSFNPQDPKSNEVRYRVERGTARSISGAATDTDKSRFRLNTPIAAIGVRGTDFIVRSDVDGVRATVADGTIVVGALGPGCAAAAVGPCGGSDARELSANMGRLMAELKAGDRVTRIVPAIDQVTSHNLGERGERAARQSAMAAARSSGIAAAEPTAGELQRGNDQAAASLLTLAKVNLPDLNRPSDLRSQLVWGRWGIVAPGDDQVSVPFSLARLGRHITVADDDFGLFRTTVAGTKSVFSDPTAASVDFHLTRGSASYTVGGASEVASITGGSLNINFALRTFATGIDLLSTSGVKGKLLAGGEIRPDGIFSVRDADQRVSGAVAHNGKEAGYLFERTAGAGLFRGVTLWGN